MTGIELSPSDQMMLEGLYWWDIPTLFRCPVDRDPRGCDIALIGVPHSTGNGTTERDQHLGPRAVRDVSAMARRVNMALACTLYVAAQRSFSASGFCRARRASAKPLRAIPGTGR